MVRCMKTTVEIVDSLLNQVRRQAAAEETTVRSLVEEGLREVLRNRRALRRFRLRDASFEGRGLRPEIEEGGWDVIRDLSYKGRGS